MLVPRASRQRIHVVPCAHGSPVNVRPNPDPHSKAGSEIPSPNAAPAGSGAGFCGDVVPGSGNGPVFSTVMSSSSVRSRSDRSMDVTGVFFTTATRFERGSALVSLPASAYRENRADAYGSTPGFGDHMNALL